MEINYKEIFFKSLKGILYGVATIVIILGTCYVVFGQDVYLYEISQYANINNLIIRSIFLIVSFIIFLFVKEVAIRAEEIKKELSFKKYFFYKMFSLMVYLIYSVSSIFVVDKFINDKYFIVTFIIVISIWGLIYIIISSIYRITLEKRINEKLRKKFNKIKIKWNYCNIYNFLV